MVLSNAKNTFLPRLRENNVPVIPGSHNHFFFEGDPNNYLKHVLSIFFLERIIPYMRSTKSSYQETQILLLIPRKLEENCRFHCLIFLFNVPAAQIIVNKLFFTLYWTIFNVNTIFFTNAVFGIYHFRRGSPISGSGSKVLILRFLHSTTKYLIDLRCRQALLDWFLILWIIPCFHQNVIT